MRCVALRIAVAISLCLGPVWPRSAWAWGDNGHIAVAKVADAFLTAQAKTKIAALLNNKPIYARSVCMFADSFKHTDAGKHTKPWHYVDIPHDKPGYDAARDCVGKDCVIAQIVEQKAILKDASASQGKRIQALKFLIHFVGDIHQPLHCADRFDDHGGNSVPIRVLEGVGITNLHAVWDSDILDENMQELDPEEYADEIKPRITPADKAAWEAVADPIKWANEGHDLANAVVYEGVPIPGGPPFTLGEAYVNRAKPEVERQIQKAGVRLAKLLNDVFP